MKRNFKLKALVLSMVVMMAITLIPSAFAEEAYKNKDGITAENADAAFTISADKKTVAPGDKIVVSVDVTKMPANNNGICAISTRLCYDASKLEIDTVKDSRGRNALAVEIGKVGTDIHVATPVDREAADKVGYRRLIVSGDVSGADAPYEAGNIYKATFKVKENAVGNIDIFLVEDTKSQETGNGFAVSGVKEVKGEYHPDKDISYFVDTTGLDGINVPVELTEIKFADDTKNVIDMADTKSIDVSNKVQLVPANTTTVSDYTWESDNTAVATVANGVITGVSNGTANIKVTYGGKEATLEVTVKTSPKTMAFDKEKQVMESEQTVDLSKELKVGPEGAQYDAATIKYVSNNTDVATVDANGAVTAKGKGTAVITATLPGTSLKATTNVSVTVPIKSISLDKEEITIYKNQTEKVTATAQPEGAEYETIGCGLQSGEGVVSVDVTNDGIVVKGLKEGTAEITVTANKNVTGDLVKTVKVTVKENKVSKAEIKNKDVVLYKGENTTLEGSYTLQEPDKEATDDTTLNWKSSDETVATVDAKGNVKGLKAGKATITLTVGNGTPATGEVEVKENKVVKVEITKLDDELVKDDTTKAEGTFTLEEPTKAATEDTTLTWTSSDEKVATIDKDGNVKALKEGKTTITLKVGEQTATKELTVKENHLAGVALDDVETEEDFDKLVEKLQNLETLKVGDVIKIPFTAYGEDEDNRVTDSADVIKDFVKAEHNKDLIDFEVEYDEKTNKGALVITVKAAGESEVVLYTEEMESDDEAAIKFTVKAVAPVVEETVENVDTSDIPVAMFAIVMTMSVAGLVATKKVLVK